MFPASIAPFRLAGADQGVNLVDKEDYLALLLGEIVQYRLDAFLELSAKLGARYERSEVEGEEAPALEPLRHFSVDDALGEALDDGGLAHAGFSDEHRVVLGSALQHLDGAPDLIVAADDRIQPALLGALGQVDAELLQCLTLFLRVLAVYALPTAQLIYCLLYVFFRRTALAQGSRGVSSRFQDREGKSSLEMN